MKISKLPYEDIGYLSKRDLAYILEEDALREFYSHSPKIESFKDIIEQRNEFPVHREVLVENLSKQYELISHNDSVSNNIRSLLDEKTFTVTTGHQPCLATGPLYFIYKIISVLKICIDLAKHYPQYNFVPVYWMGSEDHDFAEVNHFHIYGKKLSWENQSGGPVGRMNTAGIAPVMEELSTLLTDRPNDIEILTKLRNAYSGNERYDRAFFNLIHELFGQYGLIVVMPDNEILKQVFTPTMKEELLMAPSYEIVQATLNKLKAMGFKAQANPREINLFYVQNGLRKRIIRESEKYKVLDTSLEFSKDEILRELQVNPSAFSPNVILRPIYQEMVLPNIAYVGGGGEIAYWLERKDLFDHLKLSFPILIRRASVMWISRGIWKKMNKIGIDVPKLFQPLSKLSATFVKDNSSGKLNLDSEEAILVELFTKLKDKASSIDRSLVDFISAEESRAKSSIQKIGGKLLKAEKQRHENSIMTLTKIKGKLFPNDGLQERHDNFIEYYSQYGSTFFEILIENIDPIEKKFLVIADDG